ncbi:MAG TPA: biotin--[acetyl-CoA-carboxylase] ligase [Desulfomonilia bacterium]|nr:biotin--[acetyl-CoA-carboxylase] ligase [Desulfomonilia bacterium]
MSALIIKGFIEEVIDLARVDSTNQYALNTGKAGLLVRARMQTSGRGRRGRAWFSPEGENLYMTLTLTPPEERYPIIAGVAVRAAVSDLLHYQPVEIKWPNDIVISGRKVSGILCETKGSITAVGIGVNVNQADWPVDLEHRAVSLKQVSQCAFSIDAVTQTICGYLHRYLKVFRSRGFGPIRDEFLRNGMLDHHEVHDDKGKKCTIIDLTMDGHLVVVADGKKKTMIHETVSLGWDKEL